VIRAYAKSLLILSDNNVFQSEFVRFSNYYLIPVINDFCEKINFSLKDFASETR